MRRALGAIRNLSAGLWLLGGLVACESSAVYEQQQSLSEGRWHVDSALVYEFRIGDTAQPYNLFYDVRYGLDYPFYNLYVTYYLEDSAGQVWQQKLQELVLMDPVTGAPYGSGVSDLFDHRVLFVRRQQFPYVGLFRLRVVQYMRQDPLPGVRNFGLRIEAATPDA